MSLTAYNKKRNFNTTSEPKGVKSTSKAHRFVVQFHVATRAHYDFRLEYNGVLLSWAVPKGLSYDPSEKRLAVHVEDHPLDYINFAGTIPSGNYGAGEVEIFDKGTYTPTFDMDYGLKKGHLKFVLKGKKLKGEWSLIRMDEKNWLIVKSADQTAKEGASEPEKLPIKNISPMLATLSESIPSGKNWLFEIKFDGYRMLAYKEQGKISCYSRSGQDYTKKFADIVNSIEKLSAKSFCLDGEVIAVDETGKSDFSLLQKRIKEGGGPIVFAVFDLLALDGENLMDRPLIERKEKLKKLLAKCDDNLLFSEGIWGNGKRCFEFAKEHNLEGIMAKKVDSTYEQRRSLSWLKIKCYRRQEFVVLGYQVTDKNPELSALLVGYYEGDELIFAGKVGTGFDQSLRKSLKNKLDKLKQNSSPANFAKSVKEKAILVKPSLVAEIQFAEFTPDGLLRQPSFISLREDKDPKAVVREGEYGNKSLRG